MIANPRVRVRTSATLKPVSAFAITTLVDELVNAANMVSSTSRLALVSTISGLGEIKRYD